MKTKEEVIKEAWGSLWTSFEKHIDNDGWIDAAWIEDTRIELDVKDGFYRYGTPSTFIRPVSLKGIENNNGWIKIESKNIILPIDGTEVHFYYSFINENGIQNEYHKGIFNAALGFTSYYDSENYKVKEVTHYQPIEKPKPPIY